MLTPINIIRTFKLHFHTKAYIVLCLAVPKDSRLFFINYRGQKIVQLCVLCSLFLFSVIKSEYNIFCS